MIQMGYPERKTQMKHQKGGMISVPVRMQALVCEPFSRSMVCACVCLAFVSCVWRHSNPKMCIVSTVHTKTRWAEVSSKTRYRHLRVVIFTLKYEWSYLKTCLTRSWVFQVICSKMALYCILAWAPPFLCVWHSLCHVLSYTLVGCHV